MNPSQKKVMEVLSRNPASSAPDLAKSLRTTPANIRRHLLLLLEDGLVEVIGERRSGGKGRPVHLYRSRYPGEGENQHLLLSYLLQSWLGGATGKRKAERLAQLARLLAGGDTPDRKNHITRRLGEAVQRLNALNYQARWEASSGGPRLILGFCPYRRLLDGNPELCRMDHDLLERLAGASVTQSARLERTKRGDFIC
ncbi:MAG: helix-turn-helix domain-containing protein, partial [Chloroflexi bacterium]|nr:helix-turn-helix domain-containing protein [Chloroflexota bacterium]